MRSNVVFRLFLWTALLCVAGCGSDGPEIAEVSGLVTLDGQPVPGATITFFPENPEGSPSYGGTDQQGKYTLMFTRKKYGAMLGKHRVEIETPRRSASEIAEMKAEGQEVPDRPATIPKKYRQPGALTAEVNRGGNKIDFELTSK
jgi:hypothetical protein